MSDLRIIEKPVTPDQIDSIKVHLGSSAEIRPITWAPGYAASSEGFVISVRIWKREPTVPFRILKTMRHSGGYPQVNLRVGQKSHVRRIHNLIAELFLGPRPSDDAEVRHKDGNPENNAAWNLEWGSHKENVADRVRHGTDTKGERNGHSKVNETDVRRIRILMHHGVPGVVVAKAFGLTVSTVKEILREEIWSHVH